MSDQIQRALTDHLHETYSPGPAIVARWIVVAEVIDVDGDSELMVETSEGLPSWMSLGLLHAARVRSDMWATEEWDVTDDDD